MTPTERRTFAVHVYDGVEAIDVGATFGVLSMARRIAPGIHAFLVAERVGNIRAANGLCFSADYDYATCPPADVLIVTGGPGWSSEAENPATLDFIRRRAADCTIAAVCTGGLILAATGLLDGSRATTKREVTGTEQRPLDVMQARHPQIEVVEARYVDCGKVITAGGVCLAIDAILHLIERFYGIAVADETARIIEYKTAWEANKSNFPGIVARETALRGHI